MRLLILFTGLALFSQNSVTAQQKWNLQTIVEYAMANNIGVKQGEVQAKLSGLTYKQSKLSVLPNANFSGSSSLNSGNNQDPVSFGRITQTYLSAGLQLQSSVDIFNFYSKRNTIAANEWELKAAIASVGKLQNDIALSAANAYLNILLAIEQRKITEVQIGQTSDQLRLTRLQVDAGALPELNAVQLEAQLALDSVNYITAKGNVTIAILNLKSFMNIDAAAPFEVDTPPLETIPVEPIADLQPEYVYNLALTNQPQQMVNDYRLKAAEFSKDAARGAMYPSISAFGSLGSGYNNQARQIVGTNTINAPLGKVNVSGTDYSVFPLQPYTVPVFQNSMFFNQLGDNFRQGVGLSISVPIFNSGSLKTAYERSKLNIDNLNLQKTKDDQQLKQDIYQAYNAALIALEKFNASAKSVSSSQQTYDFAGKRFNVGMLGTFDLVTAQNNLLRAKLDYSINRFDYVFKMKVLEFYKGLGIKL